jgi:hypothetical protein
MKAILWSAALLSLVARANAQGVSAPWDISQTASELADQAARLTPVLDRLDPELWEKNGAPAAYVAQARSTQLEAGYLVDAARKFAKQPEKLSLAIATYFRMQSVETMINSLAEGVRRYQEPKLGDQLVGTLAANFGNRDQLRQYIADLADTREQEWKVIDSEAQRCRGDLMKLPPVRPATQKATPVKPAAVNADISIKTSTGVNNK